LNPLLTASIVVLAVALLAFVVTKIVRSRKDVASENGTSILSLSVPAQIEALVPESPKRGLLAKVVNESSDMDRKVDEAINRLILSN
jgi:hypothetical protein